MTRARPSGPCATWQLLRLLPKSFQTTVAPSIADTMVIGRHGGTQPRWFFVGKELTLLQKNAAPALMDVSAATCAFSRHALFILSIELAIDQDSESDSVSIGARDFKEPRRSQEAVDRLTWTTAIIRRVSKQGQAPAQPLGTRPTLGSRGGSACVAGASMKSAMCDTSSFTPTQQLFRWSLDSKRECLCVRTARIATRKRRPPDWVIASQHHPRFPLLLCCSSALLLDAALAGSARRDRNGVRWLHCGDGEACAREHECGGGHCLQFSDGRTRSTACQSPPAIGIW